jgi:hypothetical protein
MIALRRTAAIPIAIMAPSTAGMIQTGLCQRKLTPSQMGGKTRHAAIHRNPATSERPQNANESVFNGPDRSRSTLAVLLSANLRIAIQAVLRTIVGSSLSPNQIPYNHRG